MNFVNFTPPREGKRATNGNCEIREIRVKSRPGSRRDIVANGNPELLGTLHPPRYGEGEQPEAGERLARAQRSGTNGAPELAELYLALAQPFGDRLENEGAGDEGGGRDHPVTRLNGSDEIHLGSPLVELLCYRYNTHASRVQ